MVASGRYTGSDGKTTNELFLLVDAKKNMSLEGHKRAVRAKKERESKVDKKFGAKTKQRGNQGSDKTMCAYCALGTTNICYHTKTINVPLTHAVRLVSTSNTDVGLIFKIVAPTLPHGCPPSRHRI